MALPALLLGCDDQVSGPEGTVPLSLSVAVGTTWPITIEDSTVAAPARPVILWDDDHSLTVDRAALVLGEIRLEAASGECRIAAETSLATDDCATLHEGLVLAELPPDGVRTARVVDAFVTPGTYTDLKLQIDTPDEHLAEDQLFRELYPAFADASVRMEGTWNEDPFVFWRGLDADLELELSEPLVLDEGDAERNITLRLDPAVWFDDGEGGLVDPSTGLPDGPNEELVEDNILASFEAFEDDDRDGEDDNNEVAAPGS